MKNQNNPFNLNNSLITKEELISIIEEIWYNDEKIKMETNLKTFKIYGLTNKLDGSEDDMFNWPEENINELNEIIVDSNELKNELNYDSDLNLSDLD